LSLLMGATSSAFASTKKSGNSSSHKRSSTAGKHRTSGSHRSGTRTSKSNVPGNPN
jgi:hypothetical protein